MPTLAATECRIGDLRLPITPSTIRPVYEGHYLNHQIILAGRISTPRGREPIGLSWKGMLPGRPLTHILPFIKEWAEPQSIVRTLAEWCMIGLKVPLVISHTEINMQVFIKRFVPEIGAPYDSREYEITVEEARELDLSGTVTPLPYVREINQPPQHFPLPQNYNWRNVAADVYGNPDRWKEISDANKEVGLDNDGYLPPGTILTIPPK